MHAVLATFLAMVSSTGHNIERLPSEMPVFTAELNGLSRPATYAYDEDHCWTRPSGAIVCPRHRR